MLVDSEQRFFSAAERLDRQQLEALQFRKLKRLLDFNYANNPFYRDLWRAAKVSPDDIGSLEDFRNKIPTVEKSDVLADQQEFPPLGRRLGVPMDQVRKVHLTSGTSGMAREAWGLTQTDVELSARGHMQHFHWRGMKPGDVFMISMPRFFAAGLGSVMGADNFGLVTFELFGMPQDRALSLMRQFNPSMVIYPQAILGRMLVEQGLIPRDALPNLKAIGLNSGTSSHSKDAIDAHAERWGTRVTENYGCTQAANTMGITCEQGLSGPGASPLVHFLEERFIIECLDRETGQPAREGEECEIVLTTLDRVASPSIRYRMHDRAVFMPYHRCVCGRPYHGYQPGTIGRWDDMIKIKGINCWPSTFDEVILSFGEIVEYRGRVTRAANGAEQVEIAVAFADAANKSPEWRNDFLKRLSRLVKDRTFVSAEIVESGKPLQIFETKPRRWTDERRAGARA